MFEEHLRLFPQSDKASAALYFLGRRAELASRYPLSYYSTLVAHKLRNEASPNVDFEPSPAMKVRLERAQVTWKPRSFRNGPKSNSQWAAQNEANPYPAALALAETASRRGAYDVSIRYVKRFAPGISDHSDRSRARKFWKLAFPLPYRTALESNSRTRGLDPYIVAALIRQESEFNPKAISSGKAYGLTQVLPSDRPATEPAGRGSPASRRQCCFEPEINLKLGTYYLKSLLDQQNGKWEQTLASYNAGKSRADDWATWATFREPAEYIETIPFTETRNYIQIVLRNAHVYRRLYGT